MQRKGGEENNNVDVNRNLVVSLFRTPSSNGVTKSSSNLEERISNDETSSSERYKHCHQIFIFIPHMM